MQSQKRTHVTEVQTKVLRTNYRQHLFVTRHTVPLDVKNIVNASWKPTIVIRYTGKLQCSGQDTYGHPQQDPESYRNSNTWNHQGYRQRRYLKRERFNTIARPSLKVYAALRRLPPISTPARGFPLFFFSFSLFICICFCLYFSMFIYFCFSSILTNSYCIRNKVIKGLI